METANITFEDENGDIKVEVDDEKCIVCGRCVSACKHDARYYADDTERFFDDLKNGVPISIMTAPAISTNITEFKRLFTYLRQLGVRRIFDVSLGADICIWGHIRYLQKTDFAPLITQPCPVVVRYLEIYRQELLPRLSPVHGPMGSASVYMKKYLGITDRIAAFSPCIAKTVEFIDTGIADYNITFAKLRKYLEEQNIVLPGEETDFDHDESGLGLIFPVPGGLKENVEYFLGEKLHITNAEGFTLYDKLDKYAETPEEFLPDVYDLLNCIEGCNTGPASSYEHSVFEIDKTMNKRRRKATEQKKREVYEAAYKKYDELFDLSDFLREYKPDSASFPQITNADISKAFALLDKTDYEKQNVDCGACGSETCYRMARKIALGVNIPVNCIVKTMEDAKNEHENNVSAQKRIVEMEKHREADERMRIMLDSSPLAAHFWDESFSVVDCNQAAVKLFKLSDKREYIDKYFELTPEFQPDGARSKEKLRHYIKKTFDSGYHSFEWMRQTLAGEPLPVEMTLVKVEDKGINLVAGYCRDLREHNKMMQDLDATTKNNELQITKLHLAVQATKIGLWDIEIVDGDPGNPNNRATWSGEFRQMLGFWDENDFPSTIVSWSDRLHPDDKERVLEAFDKHLLDTTSNTPYDVEYQLMKKNGEYAHFHDSGEVIRDEYGNALRAVGSLVDITETKNLLLDTDRQRIEAEAANQAKTAFLSTMSHEIRTPMNAILGITEIQLINNSLDPPVREAFDKIYASGDLLLSIINDILDLSKIEAGKFELVINNYEIASVINDTIQLNLMRVGSKPIEFKLVIDEDMPAALKGDSLRIKQILNNLLSNAFKYTHKGEVILYAQTEPIDGNDDEVMLVLGVSDTGQGMTEEQIQSLFDEYARFNHEANSATEGTGLGMSITQNLISLMNGEILVESEPGEGSVFTVRLPQGKTRSVPLGKKRAENLMHFRANDMANMKRVQIVREPMPYGSVLIVDDVETNIYVAKGLMAPYGLKIDSAKSGYEAIEKVKAGNIYDIIFMDHMMPGMDGLETTKILREMDYAYPIVALTANAVYGQADVFLKSGLDGFISKPIDIRQLNNFLNKLIRDKQPPEVIERSRKQAAPESAQKIDSAAGQDFTKRFAEFFVRDAVKALALLEPISEKNDYGNEESMRAYIINVHGMKSALANIGNLNLSGVAAELENAARAGDLKLLESDTPAFLDALSAYTEELKPKAKEDAVEASDEDKAFLTQMLDAIKTACGEYDEQAADKALEGLRQKTWSRGTGELLDKIAEMLLHSDFDEIVELLKSND